MTLEIKAGGWYWTRSGQKAFVGYWCSRDSGYPWHGDIDGSHNCWREHGLYDDGKYGRQLDLVAEWSDPKPQPMTDDEMRELFLSRVPIVGKQTGTIFFPVYVLNNTICLGGYAPSYCHTADQLLREFTYLDGSPICSKEKS